ncbi:MAG TPA: 30S ribosomal protein S16 [Ktedonobacteraceae bacterium]|nr:30S ribosomal protein S16 [Ktedonobacteraceae bacterium]
MTVKIRLKRTGMKKAPSYRVVVADSRSPRDGRIIENLGWYNPMVEPSIIKIDEEKTLGWLKNGAQPSDSVAQLLKRTGLLARFEQSKAAAASETEAE